MRRGSHFGAHWRCNHHEAFVVRGHPEGIQTSVPEIRTTVIGKDEH